MIRSTGLLPITVLHSLSNKQKEAVLSKNIVVCLDLFEKNEILDELGIEVVVQKRVMEELRAILGR
jgi:predicted Zn-dependent protease with MMP-like domain